MKPKKMYFFLALLAISVLLLSACGKQAANTEMLNQTDNPSMQEASSPAMEKPSPSETPNIEAKTEYTMLYVGNSFIYTGDVPGQVKAIASMHGIEIDYDQVVPGGAKLSQTKDEATIKIRDNEYDFVVIQDYGERPIDERADFNADVKALCAAARGSGAVPVLYSPAWANIDAKPDVVYQDKLTAAYAKAADKNNAILVNAGDAWVYAYDKLPGISLYLPGDYHANNEGAYYTSCVFISTLFNICVEDICYKNEQYHSDNAVLLGETAWEFVNGTP